MPPRPPVPFPVPSPPTLRFLRHVVLYSSFGTFAGAAVLLAEERRRRICLARKIIDNGKRLRESSRNVRRTDASPTLADALDVDIDVLLHERSERSSYASGEVDKAYSKLERGGAKRRKRRKAPAEREPGAKGTHEAANELVELVSNPGRHVEHFMPQESRQLGSQSRLGQGFLGVNMHHEKNWLHGRGPLARRQFSTSAHRIQADYAALHFERQLNHDGVDIFSQTELTRPETITEQSLDKSRADLAHTPMSSVQSAGSAQSLEHENPPVSAKTRRLHRTLADAFHGFCKYYAERSKPQSSRAAINENFAQSSGRTELSDSDVEAHLQNFLRASDLPSVIECYVHLSGKYRRRVKIMTARQFLWLGENIISYAAQAQSGPVQALVALWSGLLHFREQHIRALLRDTIKHTCRHLLREGREQDAALLLSSTLLRDESSSSDQKSERSQNSSYSMDEVVNTVFLDQGSTMTAEELYSVLRSVDRLSSEYVSKAVSICRELVAHSYVDDAVNFFLRTLHPDWVEPTDETQDCLRSFTFHPTPTNLGELHRLVLASHSRGIVDQVLLENILSANYHQGRLRENMKIWLAHKSSIEITGKLQPVFLESVVRSLPLESSLEQVQLFVATLPQSEQERNYSRYLPKLVTRCYEETRRVETVEEFAQKMKTVLGRDTLPDAVVLRIMYLQIKAMRSIDVEDGKQPEHPMADTDKGFNYYSRNLLLSLKRGNWAGVNAFMERIDSLGYFRSGNPVLKSFIFNNILGEIVQRQRSKDAIRFVLRAIRVDNFAPNQMTLRLILKSLVKDGRTGAIRFWTRYLRRLGFRLQITNKICVDVMGTYYSTRHPTEKIFLQIRDTFHEFDKNLISREFYDLLRLTFRDPYKVAFPRTKPRLAKAKAWYISNMRKITEWESATEEAFPRRSVLGVMSSNLHMAPEATVAQYMDLVEAGTPLAGVPLEVAVEAVLRMNNWNPKQAEALIQTVHDMGIDTSAAIPPLARNRLLKKKLSPAEMRRMTMKFYENYQQYDPKVKHHLAVSVARELVDRHKTHAAIRLLSDVYTSPWSQKTPPGIEFMTCFLQAYAIQLDIKGVAWAVETILRQNMFIDPLFLRELQYARRKFHKKGINSAAEVDRDPASTDGMHALFNDWMSRCYHRYKAQTATTERMGWDLAYGLIKLRSEQAEANL